MYNNGQISLNDVVLPVINPDTADPDLREIYNPNEFGTNPDQQKSAYYRMYFIYALEQCFGPNNNIVDYFGGHYNLSYVIEKILIQMEFFPDSIPNNAEFIVDEDGVVSAMSKNIHIDLKTKDLPDLDPLFN